MLSIQQCSMAVALLAFSSVAMSELGGTFTGRTMDPLENQGNSAEISYKKHDGSDIVGRISHRYNDQILFYGDYIKVSDEIEDTDIGLDGSGFGAGFFYFLPDVGEDYDVALRASYHKLDIDSDEASIPTAQGTFLAKVELGVTLISAELVISPLVPISDNGLKWYAGAGAYRIQTDPKIPISDGTGEISGVLEKDTNTEFLASVGLVLPTEFGSAYAGADHDDENTAFGVGLRYQFQ